ncbi:MAG: ZipA [Betaproteobacteria bacterium]|nr:MAG: ZipA [Betaproteobacteria bacterium]
MDSELQVALIGAGVAAVVLIIGYNKWQERKHRRRAEEAFKSEHRDVLLEPRTGGSDGERTEPSFDGSPAAGADEPRRVREAPVKRTAPQPPEMLSAQTDCIIQLEAIEPLDAQRIWAAQRDQLNGLSKPVRWFGFDDGDNLWRPLDDHSAGKCHWFCAAMQLVDRRGPIGEVDFMRFSGGVQRIADQFMALPAGLPSRAEILRAATELDRFCADVDVQIGVNVVATSTQFEGDRIESVAGLQGLRLAGDGSFHAQDGHGNTLFTLGNLEPGLFASGGMHGVLTKGLTLVIDVPRVANGPEAFDRMMRTAAGLAEGLSGAVVDDNRTPFGAEAAGMIRSQIAQFQERMASYGIPAGGDLARRLFAV